MNKVKHLRFPQSQIKLALEEVPGILNDTIAKSVARFLVNKMSIFQFVHIGKIYQFKKNIENVYKEKYKY